MVLEIKNYNGSTTAAATTAATTPTTTATAAATTTAGSTAPTPCFTSLAQLKNDLTPYYEVVITSYMAWYDKYYYFSVIKFTTFLKVFLQLV